jgi:tRNA(Ile)-lysidine synthase
MIDCDKLSLPLRIRSVRPGDRFRPLGLRGSKKVGDFLTDRKVLSGLRDEILTVWDQNGIVWVAGYEIAERVKIDGTTRKVMVVEYRIRKRRD